MSLRISRRLMSSYIADQLQLGSDTTLLSQQVAAYLTQHRRTHELDLILRDVDYSLSRTGTIHATVTSAHELSAILKTQVEAFIVQSTDAKKVSLEAFIDPELIGGVRITTPGHLFDQTVARKLQLLRTNAKK